VTDAAVLDEGLRGVVGLVRARPFAEPLAQMLGRPSVKVDNVRVEGIASPVVAARLSFKRSGTPPASVRLMWTIDGGSLHLAAGSDVEPALALLVKSASDPQRQLRARAEVSSLQRSLGASVAAAAVVDPVELGVLPDAGSSGVLLAALGQSQSRAWLRLEIPADAMTALMRRLLVR
jgi:hypothetical protein